MEKSQSIFKSRMIAMLILISLPFLTIAQTLISIDQLSGSSENYVRGVYTGENGNTAVCGDYRTDLVAGQGVNEETVTSTGITSGYIGKYDENGDLLFLLGLASSKYGTVERTYINDDDAIYASGDYAGLMNLNPLGVSEEITSYGFSVINYSQDPFLAKYDATGNLDWYIDPVESGDSYGSLITAGTSESVIWTGFYDGFIQFEYDGGTVTYPDAPIFEYDSFIFEVDSEGEIVNHMRIAGAGVLSISEGTYDSNGNLYLTGSIQGSVDLVTPDETYTIDTETMNMKFFIIQILPDWSIGWHVTSEGESGFGRGIAVNSEGDLVFAGYFSGEENFSSSDGSNTESIVSEGDRDIFMGKYSTTGDLLDLMSLSGPYDDFLYSMILDDEDQIYLAGSFLNSFDFDPSDNSSDTESGVWTPSLFVAKYSSNIDFGWVYHAGSGVNFGEDAVGVGILDDGLICAGNFNNTVDFNPNGDPEELSSSSATDGYVLKLSNPDLVNSIQELNNIQFSIYPNPAVDQIIISVNQELKADQIVIYDLMGKPVYKKSIYSIFPGETLRLKLAHLPSGTYFISIDGDEQWRRRLVISN